MDKITEKKFKERYDEMKKTTFEDYVKIKKKQNKWLMVLGFGLILLTYSTMILGFTTWMFVVEEEDDNAAFLNIGKDLCLDKEQEYAKMEIYRGGKVVIFCEEENIIFNK